MTIRHPLPSVDSFEGLWPELFVYDTDLSEFDVELAENALAYLEAHPEEHQQDTWHLAVADDLDSPPCKTASCIAGTVTMLSPGFVSFVVDQFDAEGSPYPLPKAFAEFEDSDKEVFYANQVVYTRPGDDIEYTRDIPAFAHRALRLGERDAEQLFYGPKRAWMSVMRESGNNDYESVVPWDTYSTNAEALDVLRFLIRKAKESRVRNG